MVATLYDCTLGTDNNIRQVQSVGLSNNNQIIAGKYSAGVDPVALFLAASAPQVNIATTDIATVLGIVSPTAGLYVDGEDILIPYAERAAGSTFEGETSHVVLEATQGLFLPQSLSVSQGDPAAILQIMGYLESTDGTTHPVSVATGQTLIAQAFNNIYTLGPAVLNATAVGGHIGHSVNFGITAQPDTDSGFIYPLVHFIEARDPYIDLNFKSMAALNTFTASTLDMTSLAVYFRKRADGSTFTSGSTHLSVSFTDGIASMEQVQASDRSPATPTLRCYGEALAFSASAAIP